MQGSPIIYMINKPHLHGIATSMHADNLLSSLAVPRVVNREMLEMLELYLLFRVLVLWITIEFAVVHLL